MTKNRIQRNKARLFLVSYSVFMFFKTIRLFDKLSLGIIDNLRARTLSDLSYAVLCGICIIFIMSMRRSSFTQDRSVKILAAGLGIWLFWGILLTIGGISVFLDAPGNYRELAKYMIFIVTTIISSQIILSYDIQQEVVGITILILGGELLTAYILYFNGLDFLGNISTIFTAGERYRYAFGFFHVNTTGKICIQFFIYAGVYKALLEEKQQSVMNITIGNRSKLVGGGA